MNIKIELKSKIIDNPSLRYCEIYKITNTITNKIYIGQAVSHILNHKRYRPYGMECRFKSHISEAFSNKKNQCFYLNNSIKKYGVDVFEVSLICNCTVEEADKIETEEIIKHNSLFPNGYNLKTVGKSFHSTDESRKRVSNGLVKYFKDKKIERFKNVIINENENPEKYIKPLNRYNKQYGWYVLINKLKADFGGSCISLEESKKMALYFISLIKKNSMAKHLVVPENP